jgi:hypothetical protein
VWILTVNGELNAPFLPSHDTISTRLSCSDSQTRR